jgi:c-di-GMP-binding flagellar brake protein YcgR
VLERPLSFDSIRRTLHAAHGLILRERRRYFRCPIAIPASIQQDGSTPVYGETSDISEGGMAIRALTPLKPGVDAKVQFTLPHAPTPIRAEAKVRWCEESGQAGLRFLSLSARDGSELQNWVASEFERQLPPAEIGLCAPVSSPPPLIAPAWGELT